MFTFFRVYSRVMLPFIKYGNKLKMNRPIWSFLSMLILKQHDLLLETIKIELKREKISEVWGELPSVFGRTVGKVCPLCDASEMDDMEVICLEN